MNRVEQWGMPGWGLGGEVRKVEVGGYSRHPCNPNLREMKECIFLCYPEVLAELRRDDGSEEEREAGQADIRSNNPCGICVEQAGGLSVTLRENQRDACNGKRCVCVFVRPRSVPKSSTPRRIPSRRSPLQRINVKPPIDSMPNANAPPKRDAET